MTKKNPTGLDAMAGDGGYEESTWEKYNEFVAKRNQSLAQMHVDQLAEQCWSHRIDGALIDGHLHFDYKKFAQLIVKECIQTIRDNTPVVDEHDPVEEWDRGYIRAMVDCEHHIQEHFRVKE